MTIRPPVRPVVLAAIAAAMAGAIVVVLTVSRGDAGAAVPAAPRSQHVIIVGVPGLRWDDVTTETTPTLARLAGRGSIGALSVRAAGALTCPSDGWVTLGAGGRARGLQHLEAGGCPAGFGIAPPRASQDGGSAIRAMASFAADNETLSFGAHPGALADGLRCVGVLGRDAAIAGAHPSGRIDHYAPRLPPNPGPFLRACPVTVAGLDALGLDAAGLPEVGSRSAAGSGAAVPTGPLAGRQAQLALLDEGLATIEAARPPDSVLLVAGVADTAVPPRLHVAIADGPGFGARWLTSPSTGRQPFVQLIDIAPTAYAALGIPLPPTLTGQPVRSGGSRPGTDAAIAQLIDDDLAADSQRPLVQPFFTALVVVNLILLALASVMFRWRAWRARALRRRPVPFGISPRKLLEVAALWTASVLPASFLANAAPWWRLPGARFVHIASVLALAAGITALARAGRWGQSSLGPAACVALLSAAVLGADVILGSPMQLNSLAGYSPLVAGRFTGFGNLAFAVFAAGSLLSAAFIGQAVRRGTARTLVLVAAGLAAVIAVGGPGSDVGGIIALTPAFVLLALRGSGIRRSAVVVAAAGGIGAIAVALFAFADYARLPQNRTHLGRFIAQVGEGTAGVVIRRKAEANVSLLIDSQLTILVIAVLVFIPLVLLHGSGGMRRVFGLYPCVRAGLYATAAAAAIGFAVNDSGVAVPAFAAALAVPLSIVTTLRVRAGASRGILIAPRLRPGHGEPGAAAPDASAPGADAPSGADRALADAQHAGPAPGGVRAADTVDGSGPGPRPDPATGATPEEPGHGTGTAQEPGRETTGVEPGRESGNGLEEHSAPAEAGRREDASR